jgi:hypothetical protein
MIGSEMGLCGLRRIQKNVQKYPILVIVGLYRSEILSFGSSRKGLVLSI